MGEIDEILLKKIKNKARLYEDDALVNESILRYLLENRQVSIASDLTQIKKILDDLNEIKNNSTLS